MISLKSLCHVVQQAYFDSSVSGSVLYRLLKHDKERVQMQSSKYSSAEPYGKLVNERISASGADETESGSSFVAVGREMHPHLTILAQYVLPSQGERCGGYQELPSRAHSQLVQGYRSRLQGESRPTSRTTKPMQHLPWELSTSSGITAFSKLLMRWMCHKRDTDMHY